MFVGTLWKLIWLLMLFCYLLNVNGSKNILILSTKAWCCHTFKGEKHLVWYAGENMARRSKKK